jgi:predicted Zn-dependent protease
MSEEEFAAEEKVVVKPRIRFENVGFDSAVDLLREADEATIKASGRRNVKVVSRILMIESELCERLLITSDGASAYSSIPRTSYGYTLIGIHPQKGSAMRSSHLGASRGYPEKHSGQEAAADPAPGRTGAAH